MTKHVMPGYKVGQKKTGQKPSVLSEASDLRARIEGRRDRLGYQIQDPFNGGEGLETRTRRDFLRLLGLAAGGGVLSAALFYGPDFTRWVAKNTGITELLKKPELPSPGELKDNFYSVVVQTGDNVGDIISRVSNDYMPRVREEGTYVGRGGIGKAVTGEDKKIFKYREFSGEYERYIYPGDTVYIRKNFVRPELIKQAEGLEKKVR